MKGKLIVIEGTDCSGKETQSKLLVKKLNLMGIGEIHNTMPLSELLRRVDVSYEKLQQIFELPNISKEARFQVETDFFYEGYIKKQTELALKMEKLESKIIPDDIDYEKILNLRSEAIEKLQIIKPHSIGQASRISGVSPADISVLIVWLEQQRRIKATNDFS